MSADAELVVRWADYPNVEAELSALDLIDQAMKRLESVNAPACDQLHCVKVEIERHLGEAMFRIGRQLRKTSQVQP